jgi:hypothetical protein
MNILWWILGNLIVIGILAVVIWQIINQELHGQWAGKMQKLKADRQLFEEQKQFWEKSYSNDYQRLREKEKVIQEKEKELQGLKTTLEAQIIKNDEEKNKFFKEYNDHYHSNVAYVRRLETQLDNARQRAKRLAKQAKNQVQ